MNQSALILIAHGSKDPRWRVPFEKLIKKLKLEVGENQVFLCYMEFAEPTLMDVSKQAVQTGVRSARLLPLFMAGGAHLDKDIPPMIQAVQKEFPSFSIELLPAIGEHPRFSKLIYEIAAEAT